MSCLDVMYQVYGPPQPYFAAAYSPYPQVRGVGGVATGGWPPSLTKRNKAKGEGEGGGGEEPESEMVSEVGLHPTLVRGSARYVLPGLRERTGLQIRYAI